MSEKKHLTTNAGCPVADKLFRLMSAAQQQVLFENTARSIGGAPREIEHFRERGAQIG